MKLKRLFSDKYILLFGVVAVLTFIVTSIMYKIHFFPYMPMHSDANGYYMYLPATFVYKDLGIHFLHLLTPDPSGFENTFFLMDTGQVVDKYTMGVALLQLPFFLVGHLLAMIFTPGQVDGYSMFYQIANIASGCFYYFLGSVCVYKAGQRCASKKTCAWAVMIVTFGTGLFYYISRDGGYSHVYSYAMIALFILLIQKFEEKESWQLQLLGGIVFGLLTLVRVTNVVFVFIYLLYGVTKVKDIGARVVKVLNPKRWVLIIAGFIAVWIPQLAYWKWATGSFIVNSYDLPGNVFEEKFYWASPKILEVLFMTNRGVFFWCPVLILFVCGFIWGRDKISKLWLGSLVATILFTYITASWWAYDGLCGFTNRFFVDLSAIFMLMIVVFLDKIKDKKLLVVIAIIIIVVGLIWTNLFMVEYCFNETTKFDVHWPEIKRVFDWYLGMIHG